MRATFIPEKVDWQVSLTLSYFLSTSPNFSVTLSSIISQPPPSLSLYLRMRVGQERENENDDGWKRLLDLTI